MRARRNSRVAISLLLIRKPSHQRVVFNGNTPRLGRGIGSPTLPSLTIASFNGGIIHKTCKLLIVCRQISESLVSSVGFANIEHHQIHKVEVVSAILTRATSFLVWC